MEAGEPEQDEMSLGAGGRTVGRQRREPGGRKNQVFVKLSDEEREQVKARAANLGLTVPRLFVETVLNGSPAMVAERHQFYRELLAVRRLVAALGNNVNQLARTANATGAVSAETGPALAATSRVVDRLDALLASMSPPPQRSAPEDDA